MRVLHVIDKLSMDGINPSSCTVLFGGWYRHMAQMGCEMSVLSLARDQAVGVYLRDRDIPDHYVSGPKHSPKIINEIGQFIADQRAELVHLHGYGAAHFGRIAARKIGVLNVVHEHAVLNVKPVHFVADWLLRNKTDAAVAVSQSVMEFMIRGRSIPAERIRVIGNGIDLGRFKAKTPATSQAARESLGLGGSAPIVGTVTRFREEKGTEFLIRAFARICRQIPDARLVIVGDGPLRDALKKVAVEEGIIDAVTWLGFRQDVEEIMRAFDVQVIPSLTEGFPLALAEGMAIGNAMVVTEVGGMKELGRNERDLLFVPPKDPSAIASAAVRILSDPEMAVALSTAAPQTARSMDIAQSARSIVELYGDMLN